MTMKSDLMTRRGAAMDAKSVQLRAYRMAFEAAQPAREARLKELLARAAQKEEARFVAEAEAEVQRLALEAKQAAALRVKEEKARLLAEEAEAAQRVASAKLAAKEEAQRLYQAASATRRANALSDAGVRQAERARRLAARG